MAANSNKVMSADYLHSALGIPYQYLRQILTDLTKKGFIQSTRGRNGGFTFAKPLSQITITDIINSGEGFDNFYECILGFKKCPFDNHCAIHDKWQNTRNQIIGILEETTLSDLVNKKPG
jgi:Rrf2 family protein